MNATEDEVEVIDGYLVNNDGEVVGLAEPPPFAVDTRDGCDWVLARMAEAGGLMAGVEARRSALVANLDAQAKSHRDKLDWLKSRFGPEVEAFAKKELEGKKTRTLVLDHGRVSFRSTAGTNKIIDMPRAVQFLKDEGLGERVNVEESVAVKDVLAAIAAYDEAGGIDAPFLDRTPGGDKCKIDTGVKS